MNQLRRLPTYLELIEIAKDDGADLVATLLTHVGWNEADGLLSIHDSTSAVGRDAFSAVGFPEVGPTGASVGDVLGRAARLATSSGHPRLSGALLEFVAATWPGLDVRSDADGPTRNASSARLSGVRGAQSATNAVPVRDHWGEELFNQRQGALRRWARLQTADADKLLAVERALRHHGWHAAHSTPSPAAYPSSQGQPARAAKEAVIAGVLPRECFNGWPGDDGVRTTTGEQAYECLLVLQTAGAPGELLAPMLDAYGVTALPDGLVPRQVVAPVSDDVLAESSDADDTEVGRLTSQAEQGDFAVTDQQVTAKTRGSAQRVFAARVKGNYGWACALTGIATRDFLVASHIVPWSEDESIRLDPANGICLSTFADRAFDTGYLLVHDDYTVHVDWTRVGADDSLGDALSPFDGQSLTVPVVSPPNPDFLRRRLGVN